MFNKVVLKKKNIKSFSTLSSSVTWFHEEPGIRPYQTCEDLQPLVVLVVLCHLHGKLLVMHRS